MRILESHGVNFTTFKLEGRAHKWWQSYVLGRPVGSPPLTWGQFTQLFLDRYIPPSEREELRYQFEHLEQVQMFVTDYEARFSKLSRHALMILATDAEKVQRFVAGLHPGIRASMAREVDMGTEYQLVVEISRRIEGYRQRDIGQIQQDKRARFTGEFKGAPARGKGHFGRGQPSRPPYSAPPPPPRGAPGFSSIASPLTRLTQKGALFHWSDDCEESFQKLKTALTTSPVLMLPSGSGMYIPSHVLACVVAQSSLLGQIKARQFDDPYLAVLRETVLQGGAKEVSIGENGVSRLQGSLCVPNVDGLRETILEEAHSLWYSIHLGGMKMYHDLRQHYRWRRMKKDIVEYVARCLNCQQVKYEHQRPDGLLEQMPIPE
ncbi:uncharacterized protein [Nicotiana sylvestris]|uniref:uncharacterized protein n=1 Tax=Nicotiana sylvestris TaxID=4096 RepID=UPI00388C8563